MLRRDFGLCTLRQPMVVEKVESKELPVRDVDVCVCCLPWGRSLDVGTFVE